MRWPQRSKVGHGSGSEEMLWNVPSHFRFDLAPHGAFWYRQGQSPFEGRAVLISLPTGHSGINPEFVIAPVTVF